MTVNVDIPLVTVRAQGTDASVGVDLRALTASRHRPLPHCLRIILENLARRALAGDASEADVAKIAGWTPRTSGSGGCRP